MPESLTVTVAKLTPQELEPALRKALGIRAYLSGIGSIGRQRVVQAGSVRVEIIDDDVSEERSISFTRIPDVISLQVEKRPGGFVLRVPPDKTENRVEDRYRGLLHRHENDVLRHSHRRLVQISEIDMAMRPIAEILIRVHEYGQYVPSLGTSRSTRIKRARLARYAELLADLNFIERKGAGYVPGPSLPRDFAPDTPPSEVYEEFLGRVLQTSHNFLTDVLHLTMIKPFLRIENSYYWPAHLTRSKLRVRRGRLAGMYAGYYNRAPPRFETHLQSLVRREALVSEDGVITGADEILNPLLKEDIRSGLATAPT